MALVLSIRTQGSLAAAAQLPDLTAEGYDGAVWLWQVDDARAAQWVSRRLAKNQRVLVASPCYIAQAGQPASVEALKLHACLVVREGRTTSQAFNVWPLQNGKACDTLQTVRVTRPLCSNSGELVRDWCLAGRGIMLRSLWDIAPQLSTGQLIRVLPGWSMLNADIQWLAPHRPEVPRRIRLLIDFFKGRVCR